MTTVAARAARSTSSSAVAENACHRHTNVTDITTALTEATRRDVWTCPTPTGAVPGTCTRAPTRSAYCSSTAATVGASAPMAATNGTAPIPRCRKSRRPHMANNSRKRTRKRARKKPKAKRKRKQRKTKRLRTNYDVGTLTYPVDSN